MLEEFRLAYVAHRGRRRAGRARHGVVVAGRTGYRFVPEAERRPGHVDLRPRRLAVARRVHPGHPGHSTSSPATARCSCATARRPGSTPPRSGPRPPSRRHASSREALTRSLAVHEMQRADRLPVALYLQDAHTIREGIELVRHAEAAGLRRRVAGRQPARARRRRADGGVRRGDRADQDRLAASSTSGRATRPAWRARSRRSTTSPPAASSAASARGGTRSRRRSASTAHAPLRAMREVVDRRARPARQRDGHVRRRPTCTSTASSSTTCTRSAGPRTCRSTSAPPACR